MPRLIELTDQNQLVETSKFPHSKFPFEKFNPIQSRLFECYNESSNLMISASTSAGKAQPLTANILTPNGFKPMGEISVGDLVIGSKGQPISVTGVFPQGEKLVYTVTFNDESTTECCIDHLWSVNTRSRKSQSRPFLVKNLGEIARDLHYKDGQYKWHIPLINPIIESHIDEGFDLHPYVLGVLLGDGGIAHHVILSSDDSFIVEKVKSLLPKNVAINYAEKYDYRIVGGISESFNGGMRRNLVKQMLKSLNLFGLKSVEKFIPEKYFATNNLFRLELLRGLMDTDGSVGGFNHSAEFSSCSKRLASDVRRLVLSLGGTAKLREATSFYYDENKSKVKCQNRHRVTVNLGSLNPFSLPRKANKQGVNLDKGRNKYIISVEKKKIQKCQCISVDSKDNLYVTDNYVLTHNTVCSEMAFWHELKSRGGKCLYIGPQKALMQERIDDWSKPEHPFSKINRSICTGDYRFTADRKDELEEADLILMTSEMWNSRIRGLRLDQEHWLSQVGTVVIDEFHNLRSPSRGDKLEVAIMKMAALQPECRFVTLSATMPNAKEIGGWITKLTKRDSYILESKYRPCPLLKHFIPYDDSHWKYHAKEAAKIASALNLIRRYSEDKFIVFAHGKATGELMVDYLAKYKIDSAFHNASLPTKKRVDIEHRFREDSKFRVLVATSTLSAGLNMPARRVIVLGPYRGLDEVEVDDIDQQCGRAGRPQYDKQGDAYILLPQSNMGKHILRFQNPPMIQSQLVKPNSGDFKTLAFHITNEIHQGNIKTVQGIYDWYDKTFAAFQNKDLDSKFVTLMIDQLVKRGIIKQDGDDLEILPLGKVASLFYYSPFDVADLKRNFTTLFENKKEMDDVWISIALSHIDSNRFSIMTAAEREQLDMFVKKITVEVCVPFIGYKDFTDGVKKVAYCHNLILNGGNNVVMASTVQALRTDNDRLLEVLVALDNMVAKWGKGDYLKSLKQRMTYGVPWNLLGLCNIKGLGTAKSKKLWEANIRTIKDVIERPTLVKAVLRCSDKVLAKLTEEAKKVS